MVKLTPLFVSEHAAQHLQEITKLELNGKEIDAIEDISALVNLRVLELEDNRLDNDALEGLSHNAALTKLNLKKNALESFAGLDKLHKLIALKVPHNAITRFSTHLLSLKHLKALVANDNQIARIENLGHCTELETLVIAGNKISELKNLAALKQLKALNAGHNPIREIPDLRVHEHLEQLRLNSCKLTSVPDTIRYNPALKIVDLGNNLITSYSEIVNLAALPNLINLTLKGNPLCNEPDYETRIKALFPTLRILDNKRFDPKYLSIKQKRAGYKMKQAIKKTGVKPAKRHRRGDRDAGSASDTGATSDTGAAPARGGDDEDAMDVDGDAPKPATAVDRAPKPPRCPRSDVDNGDESAASAGAASSDPAEPRAKRQRTAPPAKAAAAEVPAKKAVPEKKPTAVKDGKQNQKQQQGKKQPAAGKDGKQKQQQQAKRPAANGPVGKGRLRSETSLSAPAKPAPAAAAEPPAVPAAAPAPAADASASAVVAPPANITGVLAVENRRPQLSTARKQQVLFELEKAAEAANDDGLGVGGWD
ncbi:hypothetical protein H9P43_008586 [Blastocladiella emersonii ATCC 22665]|nr:hypothetical protein H9P43_008586 [Blastocladiella emersonii ATCC 22665]